MPALHTHAACPEIERAEPAAPLRPATAAAAAVAAADDLVQQSSNAPLSPSSTSPSPPPGGDLRSPIDADTPATDQSMAAPSPLVDTTDTADTADADAAAGEKPVSSHSLSRKVDGEVPFSSFSPRPDSLRVHPLQDPAATFLSRDPNCSATAYPGLVPPPVSISREEYARCGDTINEEID